MNGLPTAQTCFFQLRLPPYTSQAVLAERLRYSIHNCPSIDMDNYMLSRNTEPADGSDTEYWRSTLIMDSVTQEEKKRKALNEFGLVCAFFPPLPLNSSSQCSSLLVQYRNLSLQWCHGLILSTEMLELLFKLKGAVCKV